MVEAVSLDGYGGATVSRVAELAGVSRATYYRHFADRQGCFLAAYQQQVAGARAALCDVVGVDSGAVAPGAVLDVLLGALAADPAAARLVLVEALAAPPEVRAVHEELIHEADRLLSVFLAGQALDSAIQVPATSLLAGVGQVLGARALAGGLGDSDGLRSDLLAWIDAYRLPAGVEPLPQSAWAELGRFARTIPSDDREIALLPRGASALPPETAAEVRRQRILDATARVAARHGYGSLTVARIASAARVPRTAFYSHFDDKAEAVLASQTHATQGAMAAAAAEYSAAAPWPRRVWNAMGAFLSYVAEKGDYAHLDLVESFAAGPAAIRHRQQNQMVFALFLEDGYRQNPRAGGLPRICSEAIGGAVFGLMRKLIVAGKTDRMPTLLPAAAYTILAPFIGPQEAADQVREWARGGR